MGAVTAFGLGVAAYWQSIAAGKTAFSPIDLFPAEPHRTRIAGEIKTVINQRFKRIDARMLSRADRFALCAAKEALRAAGLLDEATGKVSYSGHMGLIIGTAAGGILGLERFFRKRHFSLPIKAPLTMLTSFCLSAMGAHIATEFGISGRRLTIATVCSSSGLALAAAYDLLKAHRLDCALVVGAESLSEVTLAGFNALRSVDPETCRPFDANRKGLVLGEGAGAMVLVKDSAGSTAPHFPALTGYGLLTDVHHFTAPHPEGRAVAETILQAMARAGISPESVNYINAHGTGTPLNDAAECLGIQAAFGEHSRHLAISSTKSMVGHALGAASVLEAIAVVLAMRNGMIPPTANLQTPARECALDFVPITSRKEAVSCALSNSFAFGGSNVSLVFENRDEPKLTPSNSAVAFAEPVITGMGIVSPFGAGLQPFLNAVHENRSGLTRLSVLHEDWAGVLGGYVGLSSLRALIPVKFRRHFNRQASFLYMALKEALTHAGLDADTPAPPPSIAYGSAFGCSGNVHRFYTQLLTDGPRFASPQEFNLSVTNAPPALVAQALNLAGPLWVFVSDEVSFDICLHWAAEQIQSNLAERVIVCAAEEISESILAIHQHIGFFDAAHKNFALGEGAVCMILESRRAAEHRGAWIFGRILRWTTRQDTTCGPLTYSKSGRFLMDAVAELLDDNLKKNHAIACITPENGAPGCDEASAETMRHIRDLTGNAVPPGNPVKRLIGESGFAGGAGIAAALLESVETACNTPILSLNASRGGIHTATLIQPGPVCP
jgi:3-oxoacyl-[acyl-carrier-protein] synthase II